MQRPSEIEVLEAALAQAKAMLAKWRLNAGPHADAVRQEVGSRKAQLDDAIAQHDRNQAAVAEAERRIDGGEAAEPRLI